MTLEPASFALRYPDVILVLLLAVPALALGAPALGYCAGGAAWIIGRAGSAVAERQIAETKDFRRQIGFGVASSLLRVLLLGFAIIVVGVAGGRADGLTAALVIFGAFSVYFVGSAFTQYARRGSANP